MSLRIRLFWMKRKPSESDQCLFNRSKSGSVACNKDIAVLAAEPLHAMNDGLRERELIKDTFGKYLDHRIRD